VLTLRSRGGEASTTAATTTRVRERGRQGRERGGGEGVIDDPNNIVHGLSKGQRVIQRFKPLVLMVLSLCAACLVDFVDDLSVGVIRLSEFCKV
jgi:hypothetical protein